MPAADRPRALPSKGQAMPAPLSKAEEISAYRQWIASLPRNSYLSDMFRGTEEYVANLIVTDMAVEPLRELHNAAREAKTDLEGLQRRKADLAKEVQALERDRDLLTGGLAELRRDARKLAGV